MRVEATLWLHRLVFSRESKQPHTATAVTAFTVTPRYAVIPPARPWVRVETLPDKCQPRCSATGFIRKLANHLPLHFTKPVTIKDGTTTSLPTLKRDHERRAVCQAVNYQPGRTNGRGDAIAMDFDVDAMTIDAPKTLPPATCRPGSFTFFATCRRGCLILPLPTAGSPPSSFFLARADPLQPRGRATASTNVASREKWPLSTLQHRMLWKRVLAGSRSCIT